ncbi:MAG: CBS domain-containing protein [Pseudomonadota bacterium]
MKIQDRSEFNQKPKPYTASEDTLVVDAAKVMDDKNIGSVVVTNGQGGIAGIATERDFMRRVIAKDKDPAKTTLGDIMTREVRVAMATDELTDWLRQMSNERFRHLPVVDEDGRLLNIMSQGDFVSYTWPELINRFKENTAATLGTNKQMALIVFGVLVYALLVPVIFGLI